MKKFNCKTNKSPWARRAGLGLLSGLLLASSASPLLAQATTETVTAPAPAQKIEWQTDLNAALAQARETDSLVLLRFTAEWCAPCRVMDARVWPDSEVQSSLAKKYVIVKSDIDVEDNQAIARKYGVQAIPTLLVLDSNGEEIERGGFMSSNKLLKFLESAAKTKSESDPADDVSS